MLMPAAYNNQPSVQHAPYASASSVLALIARHRDRKLGRSYYPLTAARLQDKLPSLIRSASVARTVADALTFLGFTTPAGEPTSGWWELFDPPNGSTWRQVLAAHIYHAYALAFQRLGNSKWEFPHLDNAFRQYEPAGMRDRVVRLFEGLCRAAGIYGKPLPDRDTAPLPVPPAISTLHIETHWNLPTHPKPPTADGDAATPRLAPLLTAPSPQPAIPPTALTVSNTKSTKLATTPTPRQPATSAPLPSAASVAVADAGSPSWSPTVTGDAADTQAEVADLATRFAAVCQSYSIRLGEVLVPQAALGPRLLRLPFTLAPGETMGRLEARSVEISLALRRENPLFTPIARQGYIALDVPRRHKFNVSYRDEGLPHLLAAANAAGLPFSVGVTPEGQHLIGYFGDALPSLLVAGEPGSGKTEFLRVLLAGIIRVRPDVRVLLTSSKYFDFAAFAALPQLIGGQVYARADAAVAAIGELVAAELPRRGVLLAEAGYTSIAEYNARHPATAVPPILVVIGKVPTSLRRWHCP